MTDSLPTDNDERSGGDPNDLPVDSTRVVLGELRSLREAFESKIRYDEVRERMVQSMAEEVAAYRQGLFNTQLRLVLLDLISLHDDITRMLANPQCDAEVAGPLGFIRDTLEQSLARNGVETYVVDDDLVDRSRQKVVAVRETAEASLDRRVAARLRPGFLWNDKVLRPEWVDVYRLSSDPAAQATPLAGGERADGSAQQIDVRQVETPAGEGAER